MVAMGRDMRYFCTYFDYNYLPRGLALYRSLKKYCPSFRLWVLCMDKVSRDILLQLNLPDINLISLEDFECKDDELLNAKQNRSLLEYYFTCTPSLLLYILRNLNEADIVTYLDADLFFFSSPEPIYDEIVDYSISIIGHRFYPEISYLEKYGIYNVGWISFRNDENSLNCLRWWRKHCIEWCYNRVENGRFGDQKYLDDWPARFQKVVVIQHKGANLAPWNLANYMVSRHKNRLWVDGEPLIFFHFHNLKRINKWLYRQILDIYKVRLSRAMLQKIYLPYIKTLLKQTRVISRFLNEDHLAADIIPQKIRPNFPRHILPIRYLRMLLRQIKYLYFGIFNKEYIVAFNWQNIFTDKHPCIMSLRDK